MKQLFYILTLTLLFYSCGHKNRLEGIWIISYTQKDNEEPSQLFQKELLDFDDNKLIIVSFDDFPTNNGGIHTEEVSYLFDKLKSTIKIEKDELKIEIYQDSIILIKTDSSIYRLVLRRIMESNQKSEITSDNFKGSFIITGKNYQDSLDFINDTTLLHTGMHNTNSTTDKWGIVKYKRYYFFNIQDEFFPLMLIKSCNKDSIELEFIYIDNRKFTMTPTKSLIKSKELVGNWTEFSNSETKPPLPPGLKRESQYYRLSIEQDSIRICRYYNDEKLKWCMSNDGKLIYFSDKIFESCSSWKILGLTDEILTLKICTSSGFEERIIQFKREKADDSSTLL